MASRGVYRSSGRGNTNAWYLSETEERNLKWKQDYKRVKQEIKQAYLDGALFTLFFAAAVELLVILAIIVYRMLLGETPLTPGCYLDQALQHVVSLFVRK
ncbi:hypothetical protein [Oenococcus kitaharae]|uniref:Uncharacterized protein n=1 Tax=Oenococcus kitaharae DSM 17330 TaxID=1045004 RepID=G9WIL9_9LACO|nr:hypothetical protein [Oenococcus kitaharae]EHN58158.1 hypothetical protein OKIT_0029 [Oenococcus kitaharae DSM 17330]OEY81637.1 hypothetical protein NT95_09165 [Oenococcus kitaharae]OEY83122.1 hypothetical protein NV75_07265 [Oenococcus kitaharae]OEY84332.1 hypothetical protein NT96_03370 [Oenococcus kitaharae]